MTFGVGDWMNSAVPVLEPATKETVAKRVRPGFGSTMTFTIVPSSSSSIISKWIQSLSEDIWTGKLAE